MINKEYEIDIKDKYIHIKNYININNISDSRIEVSLKNNNLIINGSSLIIKCMDEYEMIIIGTIKGLELK